MNGMAASSQMGNGRLKEKWGISGSTIKIIAVVSMLIDHIGASFLTRIILKQARTSGMIEGGLYDVMFITRLIGRLGFPLFCFLLVEGFQKTRDVKKYAFRMVLFALISEIPFDLAFSGKVLEFNYQNIYFTLLLGLLALWAMDWISKKHLPATFGWLLVPVGVLAPAGYIFREMRGDFTGELNVFVIGALMATLIIFVVYSKDGGPEAVRQLGATLTVIVAVMLAADFLKTDYAGIGVLTIVAIYVLRAHPVMGMTAACCVLMFSSSLEITAFLAAIPIACYNGKRGLKMKYFFYGFYPAHLFILWVIAAVLGIGWIAVT